MAPLARVTSAPPRDLSNSGSSSGLSLAALALALSSPIVLRPQGLPPPAWALPAGPPRRGAVSRRGSGGPTGSIPVLGPRRGSGSAASQPPIARGGGKHCSAQVAPPPGLHRIGSGGIGHAHGGLRGGNAAPARQHSGSRCAVELRRIVLSG